MRVVITGASAGIGEATAYAFAAQGCELFLVARREDRLRQVAAECRRLGSPRALVSVHDLSVAGEGGRLVGKAIQELDGLDVLICNAGYGVYGPLQEVGPDEMAALWQVNFQSGYESIQAALPHFLDKGKGHLVLVSSVLGKTALPLASPYCATKFAQVGLGESLWGELQGSGVEVSVICPGYTRTEFQAASVVTPGASMFRRVGGDAPERVARAIQWAVESKRRLMLLTVPGKTFALLNRLFPHFTARLVSWFIQRARKRE